MSNPLNFFHAASVSTASDTEVREGFHPAGTAGHPTPESVGFEIGLILAVTLGIAYAVPLVLSLCGVD